MNIEIKLDSSKIDLILEEIEKSLPLKADFVQSFFEQITFSEQIIGFKSEINSAFGADDCLIVLEPTNLLLDFMTTLRTRNGD